MSRLIVFIVTILTLSTPVGMAVEILIPDAKSQPESMTIAPDGGVIAGSASSPHVYRVKKAATTTDVFVDASAEGPGTSDR